MPAFLHSQQQTMSNASTCPSLSKIKHAVLGKRKKDKKSTSGAPNQQRRSRTQTRRLFGELNSHTKNQSIFSIGIQLLNL